MKQITIKDGFYFGLGMSLAAAMVSVATSVVSFAVMAAIAALHS
jgi:hypothetical protein